MSTSHPPTEKFQNESEYVIWACLCINQFNIKIHAHLLRQLFTKYISVKWIVLILSLTTPHPPPLWIAFLTKICTKLYMLNFKPNPGE